MRRVVIAIALLASACGSRKASGPAWPEPSTTAEDGGESIEPRPTATYAAALEKSDAKAEEKTTAAASDEKPAASESKTDEKPATSSESSPTLEEILMTEEIIIEIEE
jgi:hypothetical protein